MSRTDKDRPDWVKYNDRSLGHVEYHDHTTHHPHRRTIARGERTLVPYGDFRWFLRHTDGTPGMTIKEDLRVFRPRYSFYDQRLIFPGRTGLLRWYFEQPQRFEYVGRECVEVVEDQTCRVEDPVTRDENACYRYCVTEPYTHLKPWFRYYSRPHAADVRRDDERRRRRTVKPAMAKFTKEYNSTGDVDDSTWQNFQHRHTPFEGGWWD